MSSKAKIINSKDFLDFVQWMQGTLPKQDFHLDFSPSRFVPGGFKKTVTGFENLLKNYIWTSSWTDWTTGNKVISNDWPTTINSLRMLGNRLNTAIRLGCQTDCFTACLAIMEWGGVNGARVFLNGHANSETLSNYLTNTSNTLNTITVRSALHSGNIPNFDSGLTKIFSIISMGQFPIYDSRVGAAIACLYEMYRQQTGASTPRIFKFPSGAARGKQIRDPGKLCSVFQHAPQLHTRQVAPHEWAWQNCVLGWLIETVLAGNTWFKEGEQNAADRSHAFEACLFMIGYDLRCLLPCPSGSAVLSSYGSNHPKPQPSQYWVPTGHSFPTVIDNYVNFRKASGTTVTETPRKAFINWLVKSGINPNTASSYCFPLGSCEFDLLERSLNDLMIIQDGGKVGLDKALENHVIDSEEHEHVCLMNVWLTGQLSKYPRKEKIDRLLQHGFAGTENSAQTILSVGKSVGIHFGLLDQTGSPTANFSAFFNGNWPTV